MYRGYKKSNSNNNNNNNNIGSYTDTIAQRTYKIFPLKYAEHFVVNRYQFDNV